jgi:hypothetical protein
MRITFLMSFLFISISLVAQHKSYLAIELEGGQKNEINYPPGTEFYLFDGGGNFILSDGDLETPFEINTPHTLIVSPKYKEESDRFTISSGRILMKEVVTPNTTRPSDFDKNEPSTSQVTARKEFFDSTVEGQRNILLVFNNGLVFRYFDDVARAWFQGDEVEISGKYLVKIPGGTAKISYNPKNGETWWVFEASGK